MSTVKVVDAERADVGARAGSEGRRGGSGLGSVGREREKEGERERGGRERRG